jgi:hypothetical protein
MAKKRRSAHFKRQVVDFAADALFETVVASFSYAFEVRAQMIEDLDALKGFWQREDEDRDEDRNEDEEEDQDEEDEEEA